MKKLSAENIVITPENLALAQTNPNVIIFMRKHVIVKMNVDQIYNHLYDTEVSNNLELFNETFKELHNIAFATFVEVTNKEITYDLGYSNPASIVARARAIDKVHKVIFKSKYKSYKDSIQLAAEAINKKDSYLRVWSNNINNLVGGWSRGFVGSLIGRTSHGKSTYMTYDTMYQIKSKKLDRVDIIAPEEPSDIFWRRIFAAELKIPVKKMIDGVIKISPQEIALVKNHYEGKIFFHELIRFNDIVDLIFTLKTEYIWIDHVNAISYPNNDQMNGIVALVNRQKQFLKENPETVIVDLSQVNTKEMKKKGRLFPSKEDAYMSTVLDHAAREFLSIYYPYKDSTDKEEYIGFAGKHKKLNYSPDLIQISVEKNSFGETGILDFRYLQDYGIFEDVPLRKTMTPNIILPEDNDLFKELMI